jgi:hypothetical protein
MNNVTIEPQTGHVNLSPLMFHEYAIQYLLCMRSFTVNISYSPVPYFLLCRAIELELKANQLESKSRMQVQTLYGHNLQKLYEDLPHIQKILDKEECKVLVHASNIYNKPKGFEYVSVYDAVTGMKNFPELDVLEQIARKLIGK